MKINVVFIMLLLSGCTSKPLFYNDFSPPEDSKQVNIAVETPAIAEVLPLNVMYRSYKCKVSRRISEREYRDALGFHNMEILLDRQGSTNVFAKNISIDGGGRCDWRLSNVTMGMQFNKNHPLSSNVNKFIGSYVVLIFDTNSPKRTGGKIKNVKGDLIITNKYFSILDKGFKGDKLQLELFGMESYEYYRITSPSIILWKPSFPEDSYVVTEYPADKLIKGLKMKSKYSNGMTSEGDSNDEMYKKLLSLTSE